MNIGIIGLGRLGSLIAKNLSSDFEIFAYDSLLKNEDLKEYDINFCDLETLCSKCDIILPIVPISSFKNVLLEIKDHLKEKTLIIDLCSVKSYPINLMKEILPKNIQILGTHPMFGPDSAAKSLFGHKIVLCKENINQHLYENIKIYLSRYGLKIIESTAQEHDKQIAHSLNLPHLIGRTLLKTHEKSIPIDTLGHRRLLKILGVVENDTWQLFEDMNNYNPFAKDALTNFANAMNGLINDLHKEI